MDRKQKESYEQWLKNFENSSGGKNALRKLETLKDENFYVGYDGRDDDRLAFLDFKERVLRACYIYSDTETLFKSHKSRLKASRSLAKLTEATIINLNTIKDFAGFHENHCINSVISILNNIKKIKRRNDTIAGISTNKELGNKKPYVETPLVIVLVKLIKHYHNKDLWYYEKKTMPLTRMPYGGWQIIKMLINAVFPVSLTEIPLTEILIKTRFNKFIKDKSDLEIFLPADPFERPIILASPVTCHFKPEPYQIR